MVALPPLHPTYYGDTQDNIHVRVCLIWQENIITIVEFCHVFYCISDLVILFERCVGTMFLCSCRLGVSSMFLCIFSISVILMFFSINISGFGHVFLVLLLVVILKLKYTKFFCKIVILILLLIYK